MKKESLIFRNSKQYINEGNGNGKGILYCGKKYSNEGCCKCGTCNGYCGPDNGCACPDCEYIYYIQQVKCYVKNVIKL